MEQGLCDAVGVHLAQVVGDEDAPAVSRIGPVALLLPYVVELSPLHHDGRRARRGGQVEEGDDEVKRLLPAGPPHGGPDTVRAQAFADLEFGQARSDLVAVMLDGLGPAVIAEMEGPR